MNQKMNTKSGILKTYVVPHPPIILPEIGQGRELEISETIDAMRQVAAEIAELKPETIILTSPHAPLYRDAFYLSCADKDSGSMRDFGFPKITESVDVDLELAELILKKADQAGLHVHGQKSKVNELDHGSLVPLRFIRQQYTDFNLLRLGLSGLSADLHYQLGETIQAAVLELNRSVVFIASGDLSHVLKADGPYGYKAQGPKFDAMVTDILSRAAFDELLEIPSELSEPAAQCGLGSFQIMAGALANRKVTANKLSYQGNFGVGYTVVTFNVEESLGSNLDEKASQEAHHPPYSPHVYLAKRTIEQYVKKGLVDNLPNNLPQYFLKEKAAVFVTLNHRGRLRGCIGTLEARTDSLAKEIQLNAISAATKDPRFPPLEEAELDDLEISVDVLSPAEKIMDVSKLDPKKFGVIVSQGNRKGVLLPNLEGVDTVEEQLKIALQKAGISSQDKYEIKRFEVIRYEE